MAEQLLARLRRRGHEVAVVTRRDSPELPRLVFLDVGHGDAVLIQYSHPVFVAVMAPLFLPGMRLRSAHLLAAAMGFALMYGTVGAIAGATTAFLIARAETGRRLGQIPTWRLAAWGIVGGLAPAVLFAALGFVVGGASVSELLPLLGLGVVSGGAGGLISGSAAAAAKRPRLPENNEPRLPAT